MEKGLVWRVGDGKNINVYAGNWVPRPTIFKPVSTPVNLQTKTTDSLISSSEKWNDDFVN